MGNATEYKKGELMKKFFSSNEWQWRLCRTVVQSIIGFLLANVDVLFANLTLDANTKAIVVGITMAILSPIMAELGKRNEENN